MPLHSLTTIYAQPSDQELVTRICLRETDALDELYTRYSRAIYGLSRRIIQDQTMAEDAALEVFMRVWNSAASWDATKGSLLSWMFSITRHVAIDMLRRQNCRVHDRAAELYEDTLLVLDDDAEDLFGFDRALVNRLIAQLPPPQSEVIVLAFFQGMTHVEMAEHLHEPLGTVKTRVRLGMEKLRNLWIDATLQPV